VARARCVVAEAEVALVSRDLGFPAKALDTARATLEEHGDVVNAAHARYLEVRRLLPDRAHRRGRARSPRSIRALSSRVEDRPRAGGRGIAIRRLRTRTARAALARAGHAARQARILHCRRRSGAHSSF
jgi:hypothetical protein